MQKLWQSRGNGLLSHRYSALTVHIMGRWAKNEGALAHIKSEAVDCDVGVSVCAAFSCEAR